MRGRLSPRALPGRLPIRLRLTVIFVLAMGILLAGIGVFVYYWTKSSIDNSIADSLRSRVTAVRAYAAQRPDGAVTFVPPGERFAQVLAPDGRVIDSSPASLPAQLTPLQVRTAATGPVFSERHEQARFLATPVRLAGDRRAVAVVGTSLAEHERALEGLAAALVIGLPLALIIAGGVGYAMTAGALRPVEAMREEAATISRATRSAQLPVPEPDDELRRLSLTLNEMLARLAAAAESERRFVANASHELRTPLAALSAELELAAEPGADVRAALARVRGDVARLIELSESLLDVERADAGAGLARERIVVARLLEAAAAQARPRAAEAGRALRVEPDGHVTVTGDPLALRRALTNLIDNALVHGAGEIVVGTDSHDAVTDLWVRDGGRLDPAVRDLAFERFARGPEAANRPGAGLGLSLVRAIAEHHGGEAVIEDVDGGVRAVLRLPRDKTV